MRLTRRIALQLLVFGVISLIAVTIMVFRYMQIPSTLFGYDRYTVTVQLAQAGGLYKGGNVTYRGTEVGRVIDIRLTDNGAEAVLSMKAGTNIPANLNAEVHSVSAVGEQYVALMPRTDRGPLLKNGDVIPLDRSHVPPDINSLLAETNDGLKAIPGNNLRTAIDEGYIAFGGLGPELSRLIQGSTKLAIDARKDVNSLLTLIDHSKPLLDSQSQTSDSIQAWAHNLANVTSQLRDNDPSVDRLLHKGGPAADQARQLVDRLQPTLPILLANLVSVGQVAVTYRDDLEMALVVVPQVVADVQAIMVANANTKQDYVGAYLSFNLNLNFPPPCTTGFMPIQQQRAASYQDEPIPPKGDVYCRIPQDSYNAVRGARNYPCETHPGKRAPTAKMCESDEVYVPLNDGFNWKGDPNATYTGQDVPQLRPGEGPPDAPKPGLAPPNPVPGPPPIAAVQYDPATGLYTGPDGRAYTQADLAPSGGKEKTWQQMLTPHN